MMVGDMNYMDTFVRPLNDNDSATLRFSVMAFFIMSLFLLFVPILLMNLLVCVKLSGHKTQNSYKMNLISLLVQKLFVSL